MRLAVYEWGDAAAPPLFLVHGGFDFAGTFDVLAPKLAEGGFRVVSWDQRGHGDSQHAALYSLGGGPARRHRGDGVGHVVAGAGDRPLQGRRR